MGSKDKIAYLRSLEKTEQCDLTFWLTFTHLRFGSLDQEIKSVRNINDTIESLLNHTKNIIIKLYQDKGISDIQEERLAGEMKISLSRNDQVFQGKMSCQNVLQYKNKIKFNIFGIIYRIVVNAPLVHELTMPKFIYANTCVKPQRFRAIHIHKGLSKYRWSRSKDKIRWSDVFYEIAYSTSLEDLGHYLKLTVFPHSKDGTIGPVVEVVSENIVDMLPDIPRTSTKANYRKQYTENKLSGRSLRVVSYNILAERYTDDNQFHYCDPKYLSINYRRQVILEELINYKADLICMQEVDVDQYNDYFKEHFKNNGYIPVFYKKGHLLPEGLAFVFDRNRFKKLDCTHIVLSHQLKTNNFFKDILNFMKTYKEVKELFMKQHTSLLVTTLKLVETGDILIVANTHLYYHCEAGHIRLLQIAMILKYIKLQVKRIKSKEATKVSVIFCGDFNSKPETAVYQFLTRGEVKEYEENLDCIGGAR
ncbi:hypothetical protein AMK59_7673, partial [Oryctes borbonicus]